MIIFFSIFSNIQKKLINSLLAVAFNKTYLNKYILPICTNICIDVCVCVCFCRIYFSADEKRRGKRRGRVLYSTVGNRFMDYPNFIASPSIAVSALHCNALQCIALHCNAMQCSALHCIHCSVVWQKECLKSHLEDLFPHGKYTDEQKPKSNSLRSLWICHE